MDLKTGNLDGVTVVNVTPHSVIFSERGEDIEVPPSGEVINAWVEESEVGQRGTMTFIESNVFPTQNGETLLAEIEAAYPGALIVGSRIAAEAYPGRIVALTGAPGFGRRAEGSSKRYNPRKFVTFSPKREGTVANAFVEAMTDMLDEMNATVIAWEQRFQVLGNGHEKQG